MFDHQDQTSSWHQRRWIDYTKPDQLPEKAPEIRRRYTSSTRWPSSSSGNKSWCAHSDTNTGWKSLHQRTQSPDYTKWYVSADTQWMESTHTTAPSLSWEEGVCELCWDWRRGEPWPLKFEQCRFCGDKPSRHHGQCCPHKEATSSTRRSLH